MGKSSTTFTDGYRSYAFKDETGKKYGKLTVIERVENSKFGTARWKCKCDCGNMTEANTGALTCDKKKSCGCLTPTKSAENSIKSRTKSQSELKYQSLKVLFASNLSTCP